MIPFDFRSRSAWLSLAFLSFGFCFLNANAYASTVPKNLQVIDLATAASDVELTKAQTAFHDRSAIIRLVGATKADLSRLLNVQLPDVEATIKHGRRKIPMTGHGEKLQLQAVAVYTDGEGIVRSVQTFAPVDSDETKWRSLFESWISRELSRAAGALLGDPSPPAQAWTTMYVTTAQAYGINGDEEDNISVYRLNTTDTTTDYYMVYTVPTVKPDWNGYCNGFTSCGWHTYSRHLATSLTGAQLVDHGPTGTIETSEGGFTIGGGVGPTGPGASASFGASWTQPDVVTTDTSKDAAGGWDEEFGSAYVRCNPAGGNVPVTSSGTFLSRQGAIFTVPAGTTSIQPIVEADAEFCSHGIDSIGTDSSTVSLQFNGLLGAPVLSALPGNLTIPARGTIPLFVSAYIPNSPQGLAWTITSNHANSWLSVPSAGPFSGNEVVAVSVSPGTADGSIGTLSIDTVPPFAAPAVRSGPIQVKVTVGTPKSTNRAGVLLLGGLSSSQQLGGTVFYDVNSKQVEPVNQPNVARYLHTATQLHSGKILVVGGATDVPLDVGGKLKPTGVTELFDLSTLTFNLTGALATPRYGHSAVLLPDGKVLIVGGNNRHYGGLAQGAELYDPASGAFTAAGTMNTLRKGNAATLISGPGEPAQVLVYGGYVLRDRQTSTEIWSEATRTFATGPDMPSGQGYFPTPVESSQGQFVIAGGVDRSSKVLANTQVLVLPSTFANGPALNYVRLGHTLTALAGGTGLIAIGGAPNRTAELETGNLWKVLSGSGSCPGSPGCMVAIRYDHTATLLPDGTVFVAGGIDANSNVLGSSEIYDPAAERFSPGVALPSQTQHTATFLSTSTVSLIAGPSPAAFGQKVTLVATVSVATGTPSGKVTFFDGSSAIGTSPVNSGSASLETSSLAVGSHALTAGYAADPVNLPATSAPVTEVIGKSATSTSLTSSANPSGIGQPVRFTAEVASTPSGATGSVSFKDGAGILAVVPLSAGTASFSTSTLASGDHNITATYAGDASHASSTSPILVQKVVEKKTTTKLTANPTTASYGAPVSLIATVSGTGPIAGIVLFKDGSASLGSVQLTGGKAQISVTSLAVAPHSVTATYTGDATHAGSVSIIVTVTVTQAVARITLVSSTNPSIFGQPVTFRALITGAGAGAVAPSGTVLFSDGANPIGSAQPISNGSANISTSNLSDGTHFISAAYNGDVNYASAASTALKQVVNGSSTQTVVQSSQNPSAAGQAVSFAITVKSTQGVPTGSVQLLDGRSPLGTVKLTNGVGALPTSSLGVGPHTVIAVYAGDLDHTGSTSLPVVQLVNKVTTVTTLSASPSSTVFGEPLILKAVVTGSSASGTVAFNDHGEPIGSATLTGGNATLQVASLPVGVHKLTASYRGDPSNGASLSAPIPVTVGMASTAVQLTSSLNPSSTGQPVTLTAMVSSRFGTPIGTLVFMDGVLQIAAPQPLVNGTAKVTTSALAAGPHIITARYSGNTNYTRSISPDLTQTVNATKFPVTLKLISSPNPSLDGQTVLFTTSASSTDGGVPTGSITISEGSVIYGAGTLVRGTALVSTQSILEGIHELRATYGGDATHLGATSEPVIQTVN